MQGLGRMLLMLGALLLLSGGLILLFARVGLPLGRLPGDLALRGKHFSFYAPIATCLLLSAALSLLFWIINTLRR